VINMKIQSIDLRIFIAAIFIFFVGYSGIASAAPVISNVTASSDTVGKYEILTTDFNVTTTATNYYWPYDENTPTSIPAKAGVSVDGLFSSDNWATTITVPAYYFQNYTSRLATGDGISWVQDESFMPDGSPHWQLRFAPTTIGQWRYKIRVQDSSGTTIYPASGDFQFDCASSSNHGFVGISPTDSRYFELSDGTPLLAVGVNYNFRTTFYANTILGTCGSNGVKLIRIWMNYRGDTGIFGEPSDGRWSMLKINASGGRKSTDRYSAYLDSGNYCYQNIYLPAGKLYKFTGYIKTSSVVASEGKGVFAAMGTYGAWKCKSEPLQGDNDWTSFSISFTPTTSQSYYIYVGAQEITSGRAFFDDLSLKSSEDGGATWSGEYLSHGDMDGQNYIDQVNAWKADRIFQLAKSNGVYLKAVITDKGDYTLDSIDADGTTGSASNSNFYASSSHPSRWLQKAWWRYLTARWGCYTSVHSWELCNEGDPFNAYHYEAANAFADYIHSIDPNRHLCTTSFWHSIPMEFWKSSSCDYIDVHEYFGPTVASTGSHGPRYYAWYDSYETEPLPISTSSSERSMDTNTSHSGNKSHKVVAYDGATDFSSARTGYVAAYHIGIDPTHRYTVRYWAKGNNITNLSSLAWMRPMVSIIFSKAYHENDFVSEQMINADLGTYDWTQYQQTGIVPASLSNTANIYIICTRGASGSGNGTFWVDDIEFVDEDTGEKLFVDGGMEGSRIDYDSALATFKYGLMLNSYGKRISKPVIWGETGIRGLNVYGSPYKDYNYNDENQQLVDDTSGIHLKKMVWAHISPNNPNMLYWWNENLTNKNLWHYYGAFQDFMSGINISNGHYINAAATTSSSTLRAWGQKDPVNNTCHLWIDNIPYNWKSVVDGVAVPAASGTVTVSGLKDATYQVEWWDTSSGAIKSNEEVTCSDGNLTLNVSNLQSDVACKIYLLPAKVDLRILVPSSQVIPGQTVTVTVEYTNSGETDGHNVVVTAGVPNEMEYVTGSAEETGGTWDSVDRSVTWVIESVAAHETGIRTFRAEVK